MKRILAMIFSTLIAGPAVSAEIGDDGLHKAEWFRDTFMDLQEDAQEAADEGKNLVLIVEQRGCIYCKEMHEKTFPDPRIQALLFDDFFPVQINLHGDIEIVDTDGEVLSEKQAVRKWGVLFTPTMIFLPKDVDFDQSAASQAASVMPGAFGKGTTLDMFTWVKEERFLDQSTEDFQRYHARRIQERNDGQTE